MPWGHSMHAVDPQSEREVRRALECVLAKDETSSAERGMQVDTFLRHLRKAGLRISDCRVASAGGADCGACVCVDAPGRTSSLLLPEGSRIAAAQREALTTLLREAVAAAATRRVQLLQGMTAVDDTVQAELLREAGFECLARLIYMERELDRSALPSNAFPSVTWVTYAPETHGMFARVLAQTYEGSRDCVALSGRRDVEDILASHRAAGPFDPRLWMLALVEEEPVGLLLLSRLPDRLRHEIVYAGLLPAYRGRGYGAALMARAIRLARKDLATALTLAVDERNMPARGLYQRFGFVEWMRRDAWMRFV